MAVSPARVACFDDRPTGSDAQWLNPVLRRAGSVAPLGAAWILGLALWRGHAFCSGIVVVSASRPTAAKLETVITRSLGEGESVNRGFRPWMRIIGYAKARVGQPFHLSARKGLGGITTPTLVVLGVS
jgi:hypothetical protein